MGKGRTSFNAVWEEANSRDGEIADTGERGNN